MSTYLYGAFDCMFLSCHVPVSEGIHTLYIQATIERGITLKCVSDMIRTYRQILMLVENHQQLDHAILESYI